jgi:hypothetical protein
MEHDPLSNGDNGLLRLVQRRQLRLDGISAIRHGGHSQMLSYIVSSQANLPSELMLWDDVVFEILQGEAEAVQAQTLSWQPSPVNHREASLTIQVADTTHFST